MSEVTKQDLERVFQAMKTPYKKGFVLQEKDVLIDCATIFRYGTQWRMMYVRNDPRVPPEQRGYETWMAVSDDLLHWTPMGRVLSQRHTGWDSLQCDGGIILLDPAWEGNHAPEKVNGSYWMSYIGGSLPGYETDPLQMGMAFCSGLDTAQEWERLDAPILRMDDTDVREFECKTLYKSTVIRDPDSRLGAPYVMYYNAKGSRFSIEEIGIALSEDMVHWRRHGAASVVQSGLPKDRWSIAGDPQIVRFGDLWVMHYFVAHAKGTGITGFDTFAVSKNLEDWSCWDGPPLVRPGEPYDATCAHKPFVLCHEGVVYHFYCAVGEQGRGLAVATSAP